MFVLSAIYANAPDTWFDAEYYVKRHAPMARDLLQSYGLLEMRLLLPTAQPPGWPEAAYHAIGELAFLTAGGFERAFAAHGDALAADAANYTNAPPQMQVVDRTFV